MKRIFTTLVALAVAAIALVALAACGDSAAGSSAAQQAAKQQFLADRGGNATPGANASGTPGPGGVPRIFGTVDKIDGSKLTVKSVADSSDTVVELAAKATVYKQAAGQLSDIKVGDTVTASGVHSGTVVDATSVQIGEGVGDFAGGRGGFGGFPGASGTPNPSRTPGARNGRFNGAFPSGTPPAGFPGRQGGTASGTPGVPRSFVAGTVEKIEGDTYTVKTTAGETVTFKTSAGTRVQKRVEATAADIAVGNTIVATGTASANGVFEATSVQIAEGFGGQNAPPLPATPQP